MYCVKYNMLIVNLYLLHVIPFISLVFLTD